MKTKGYKNIDPILKKYKPRHFENKNVNDVFYKLDKVVSILRDKGWSYEEISNHAEGILEEIKMEKMNKE